MDSELNRQCRALERAATAGGYSSWMDIGLRVLRLARVYKSHQVQQIVAEKYPNLPWRDLETMAITAWKLRTGGGKTKERLY